MELWVRDKIKELLALPETIKYINDNNFNLIYSDAEEYEADPEIVGNLTYAFLEAGLDPLKLDRVLAYYIPYGYLAFTGIKDFEVPSSIKSVGIKAFQSSRLDNFICPKDSQLALFGYKAFMNCSDLEEITIPDSVETLGYNCFSFSGLKRLYIGSGVKELCNNQFDCCLDLEDVTYNGTIEQLKLLANDGRLFPKFFPNCPKLKTIKCKDGDYEIVEKY